MMGCDGSTPSGTSGGPSATGGAVLSSMEYGRLVDVYAYQRIDVVRDDRRDTANRVPVLIQKDVLIQPSIETQSLFDNFGNARLDADYRFMPFDVTVGHEQLLILWDSRVPPEKAGFESALSRATSSLPYVPGSFRNQDTSKRPIPVVPRNAAVRLNFDRDLGVNTAFFQANPSAIQLLEFITPEGSSSDSFRPIPLRLLPGGSSLILDTSLIGGESQNGRNTAGLPSSADNRTANIRIALPTVGIVSKLIDFSEDPVAELNGVDANGDNAVIRDFRSGNVADGPVGALSDTETPMLVAHLTMGVTNVDTANRILTLNKRSLSVPVRGRIPYVDGALDGNTGLALGPTTVPLSTPLRSGDVIKQVVLTAGGETVTVRAEVVMNMDVGNIVGDPAFKGLGMNRVSADPGLAADGSDAAFVRVKVTNLTVKDSFGEDVAFRANSLPLGEDCEVRVSYYHNVPYKPASAGAVVAVSDAGRAQLFLSVDPKPPVLGPGGGVNVGGLVDPMASVAMRFSEPMNLETLDPFENYMLTNWTIEGGDLLDLLSQPKPLGLSLIAANLLDQEGDGTLWQLKPPLGHFHELGAAEKYWFHMVLDSRAPTDMAGNRVDVYDRSPAPIKNLSIAYELDDEADENHVGYRVFRFATRDENGSAMGSQDAFGQFQLLDGALRAMPVLRYSAVADSQILSGIPRFDRGECDVASDPMAEPPVPMGIAPLGGMAGLRFECPSMLVAGTPPGGGVSEPHNPRGSRLQMTYVEDDFGLPYHDATKLLLDVEQMHWAPFNDTDILFDVFDRYTIRMAHSDWRPDMAFVVANGSCIQDCFAGRSGLRPTFNDNLLEGTSFETVVKDKVYEINPNDAFRAPSGTKFVPYPQFQKSFTWRDPRLVTWDMGMDEAKGFGGAHQPAAPTALRDTTASVSSPYVPDLIPKGPPDDFSTLHVGTGWVFDYGDFHGFRQRDHSPIALPMLLDFSVYPEGPSNGGYALGSNQFHIAVVGECNAAYYNQTAMCTGVMFPETRIHQSGGIDLISGNDIYVNPDTASVATGSTINDVILGQVPVSGLDDHLHWAQADFVRRVSMVTYGFFDTLRPNSHDFQNPRSPLPAEVVWSGRAWPNGVPDLSSHGTGVEDLVTLMDPPLSSQPIGTRVVIEWRGADGFDNDDTIFSQTDDTNETLAWSNLDLVKNRGNLLNPFYACEAYRYAMQNEMTDQGLEPYQAAHTYAFPAGARVPAEGLTPYVTEDRLDLIRGTNGLLPQFMNYRLIMENNMTSNPPISPSLRSLGVAYRVGKD